MLDSAAGMSAELGLGLPHYGPLYVTRSQDQEILIKRLYLEKSKIMYNKIIII